MPRTSDPVSLVPLAPALLAEAWGTFLLVFFGCGTVHTAVLCGAQSGLWQVAVVWGIAISLAIYCVADRSGAHLNPAMTLAFAIWGRHPWARVPPYFLAQTSAAFLAASVLYVFFNPYLLQKETEKKVVRGELGSIVTAMCYGEYFPNPGAMAASAEPFSEAACAQYQKLVSPLAAGLAEFLGTGILAVVVFAVTDPRNQNRPGANLAPIFIGLTVSVLISVLAPLTQAGFNPARDFGPRLFAFFAGWGSVALPLGSDWSWLTVYILAPFAGGICGSSFYECALRTPPEVTRSRAGQEEK